MLAASAKDASTCISGHFVEVKVTGPHDTGLELAGQWRGAHLGTHYCDQAGAEKAAPQFSPLSGGLAGSIGLPIRDKRLTA